MSEPVIKASKTRACPKCERGYAVDTFGQSWMHCSFCDVDTTPLYGPDALVRAVLAGIAHGAGEGLAFVETNPGDIAEANVIVDRLTKGGT